MTRVRFFPKNPLRLIPLLLLGGLLVAWRLAEVRLAHRVHDFAGVMSDEQKELMDGALEEMHDLYGVDVQYLIYADSQAYDARTTALREARTRRVGGDAGGRGLVVVFDYSRRRMAIEVGPHLQGVFTDAYTGYLLRSHLDFFTERVNTEVGLRGLSFLIMFRAQDALLGNEWDPRRIEYVRDSTRLAIGGGAHREMTEGLDPNARRRLPPALKTYFSAQPTPALLLARYHEWTALDVIDHRVDLFTPSSQIALDNMPYSRPFRDIEFAKTTGHHYEFIVRDTLAVMYTTTSPLIPPSLLRHSATGWQFDVRAEWRCVPVFQGGGFVWGWTNCPDGYDSVFYDQFVVIDGVARMSGGDNRQLPVGRDRYDGRLSLGREIGRVVGALFGRL